MVVAVRRTMPTAIVSNFLKEKLRKQTSFSKKLKVSGIKRHESHKTNCCGKKKSQKTQDISFDS